jgi:hypothetical protein
MRTEGTHMSLPEAETLIDEKPIWLQPHIRALQHALDCHDRLRLHGASLLLSPQGHWREGSFVPPQPCTSTFLRPFAPRALPRFLATMNALTPARLALRAQHSGNEHQPLTGQVSPIHSTRTSMHSVSNHLTRPVIAYVLPAQRDRLPSDRSDGFALSILGSGLRPSLGGSSLRPAESSSSSYGLHVRLQLLSTPPHGDAVTFDYRERASPGRGLAPLCVRQLSGALGANDDSPLQAERTNGTRLPFI